MSRLAFALVQVLAGLTVVLAIALVNGGYVYRTQCPRVGGTETDWSYRIFQVFPYIGYERSGCESRTATRVALDAIGVWKLGAARAAPAPVDHSNEYAAPQIAGMRTNCADSGRSTAFCRCMVSEATRRFSSVELQEVTSASRFDELSDSLGRRARDLATAVEHGC